MTLFDKVLLLITGLTALYMVWRFYRDLQSGDRPRQSAILYILSFAVLLASGLLLIAFGYDILPHPLVVVVASLIPVTLAGGLVAEHKPDQARLYGIFAVVGMLALAVTRFTGPRALSILTLILVHGVAGLIIFGLPLWYSYKRLAPRGFAWVGVGGALIGIGGIALAFLKAGRPILPAEVIFLILAPLLLLMTASFAAGFLTGGTPSKGS
ncbi:MAG: hypothetical protein DIU55_002070 [Bacillota bacterium]